MKKFIKLFTLVLVSFLFINEVNAGFNCDFNVTETGINSSEFEITMPICKKTEQAGFMEVTTGIGAAGGRKRTYFSAYNSGLELTDVYYDVETADGKDIYQVHGKIPVCNDSSRRVVAYSTCTARKAKVDGYNRCSYYNGNESGCNAYADKGCTYINGTCTGSAIVRTYKYCPTGWTEEEGTGYCKMTYNYSKVVTSNSDAAPYTACTSATGGSCSCTAPTLGITGVEYALECPAYRCVPEKTQISACTPEFKLDGDSLYCVNPGQHFNVGYNVDSDFNVRNCSNSYVTPDCGYANILIEGAFHDKTSDDAINLALRLWSYHTEQAGFEETHKTGIANRMGASCDTPVFFMKEGDSRPNAYANTYNYIMNTHKNDYFEKAQSIMNSNNYLPSYISNPKTNTASFTGATFKEIACNGTVGVTCGKGSYTTAFELYFNTLLGNKYMMDHLDQLYKEEGKEVTTTGASLVEEDDAVWVVVEFETEEFEKVFGKEEEIPCNENDPRYKAHPEIAPYCKLEVKYYDQNDNEIVDEKGFEYCRKSTGCHRKTSLKAICTTETGGQRISKVEVKETKPQSGTSIRKLIPCGTDIESQIMFQYVPYEKPGIHQERPSETVTYYTNYLCGDGCTEYETRVDKESKCSNELNKPYTKTVSDPSLSCIVNMANPDQKNYYDYSSKLGVNTNFCKVYCSDKVEYTIAGRTDAESGRSFKYDVRTDTTNAKLKDYALSSVIKQRRTCVSEVFYDNLNKNVNWKQIYGLTNSENDLLMANATWTTLFNIMAKKSESERGRKENLNQLVYDLYNCNFYNLDLSDSQLKAKYGIYKPGNYKQKSAWTVITQLFGASNNYGISDSTKFSDVVAYEGGAPVAEYNNTNEGNVVGKIGQGAYKVVTEAKTVVSGTTALIKTNDAYINYCKTKQGHVCLKYNKSNEDYKYAEFGKNSTTASSHGYTFPTNNYALFVAENETGFYNNDVYQIFENSGNVIKNTTYDDLLTLDKYKYPLSVWAANECDNNECKVTQTINVSPFFRAKTKDNFQDAIKDKEFTCSVAVKNTFCTGDNCYSNESAYNDLYRNVDPAKLFPNGLSEHSNWNTEEGLKLIERIEGTADLLTTSDELVDYRITLNPQQIKAIKDYNDSAGDYSKEIISCTASNINDDGTTFEGCTSRFLDILRGKSNEYGDGSGYGTLDPEFTGVSKYSKEHGE